MFARARVYVFYMTLDKIIASEFTKTKHNRLSL